MDKYKLEGMIRQMFCLRDEALEKLAEIEFLIKEIAGPEDRGMAHERARAYWLSHVEANLSSEPGSFQGSMVNFEDTINDLREIIDSEHEDDCDCVECTARREPGGLDHDPTNTDNEAEEDANIYKEED